MGSTKFEEYKRCYVQNNQVTEGVPSNVKREQNFVQDGQIVEHPFFRLSQVRVQLLKIIGIVGGQSKDHVYEFFHGEPLWCSSSLCSAVGNWILFAFFSCSCNNSLINENNSLINVCFRPIRSQDFQAIQSRARIPSQIADNTRLFKK